jgi:hypothetical protein
MAAAVTVGEIRSLVERFADVLEANKADRAAVRGLRDLCAMFAGGEEKTVPAFLKIASRAHLPSSAPTRPLIASIVPVLASLRMFVNEFAKKDLNKSLDSLLDMLRTNVDTPIAVLVTAVIQEVASASRPNGKKGAEAMDDGLIDDYVKRLEAALGDDCGFKLVLQELHSDGRVAQPEAVAIASRFYGRTPKGTSRAKALERVQERQDKLMEFKRRPSTAGRSAA